MSDLKGFSLRKKHGRRIVPKDGDQDVPAMPDDRSRYALQENYGTNGASTDSQSKSRSRSRPGGTTSDFVKKRYSVRYAQTPEFNPNDAPPVPGIPLIPGSFGPPNGRGEQSARRNRSADLGLLKDTSLQPEEGEHTS